MRSELQGHCHPHGTYTLLEVQTLSLFFSCYPEGTHKTNALLQNEYMFQEAQSAFWQKSALFYTADVLVLLLIQRGNPFLVSTKVMAANRRSFS